MSAQADLGPAGRALVEYLKQFRPAQGGVRAMAAMGAHSRAEWPAHSQWASYLNGSKIIPYELLNELLQLRYVRRVPAEEKRKAEVLWKAARAERERAGSAESHQQIELDYQRKLNASLETELALQAFVHAQSRAIEGLTMMTVLLFEQKSRAERDLRHTREELVRAEATTYRARLEQILRDLEQSIAAIDIRLGRTQTKRERAAQNRTVAEGLRVEAMRQAARIRDALEALGAQETLHTSSMDSADTPAGGLELPVTVLSMDDVDTALEAVEEQQQADSTTLARVQQQIDEERDDPPGTQATDGQTSPPDVIDIQPGGAVQSLSTTSPDQTAPGETPEAATSNGHSDGEPGGKESGSTVQTRRPAVSRRRLLTLATTAVGTGVVATAATLAIHARGNGSPKSNGGTHSPTTASTPPKPSVQEKITLSEEISGISQGSENSELIAMTINSTGTKAYINKIPPGGRWIDLRQFDTFEAFVALATSASTIYYVDRIRLYAMGMGGNLRWSKPLDPGKSGMSGVILKVGTDGTAYASINSDGGDGPGDLLAYQEDGTLLWRSSLGGVDSLPLTTKDTVYAGCYDNRLYAIDARTGSTRWSVLLGGDVGTPAISGSTIATGVSGSTDLFAVTSDGKHSWTAKNRGGGQYSVTNAMGELFITTANGQLLATHANGRAAWDFPSPDHTASATMTQSNPTVAGDTIYWSNGTTVYAIDKSGMQLWSIDIQQDLSDDIAPIVFGKHIYVASGSVVIAIQAP